MKMTGRDLGAVFGTFASLYNTIPQPLWIASKARNIRPITSLTSDWLPRLDLHSISRGLAIVGSRSRDQTAKSTPWSSVLLPRAIVGAPLALMAS